MLDLLKYTLEYWRHTDLEKVAVIGVQHILESTFEMFRALKFCGLHPHYVYLLGKCYSTSNSVYKDFKKEGFHISSRSLFFDSHLSYDDVHKNNIHSFFIDSLQKIDFNQIEKLVILDDGGELICLCNELNLGGISIVGIEQTSAGYEKLKNKNLNFPVINVARSKAKLTQETPFIVKSVLNRLIYHLSIDRIKGSNILILGHGNLGKSLEEALQYYSNVETFDIKAPNEKSLPILLQQADIVLGASGAVSLSYDHYKYLKKENATLVSVSSSDREFEAWKFRRKLPKSRNPNSNFTKGNITLLQSGFPINFWKSRNNIKLQHIQITLSLLMSSLFQGITLLHLKPGLCDLYPDYEASIIQQFQKILPSVTLVAKEKLNP